MHPRVLRRRFWIESVLAAASGLLAVITVFAHDWIEVVFRVDPDHGNGSVEWLIVAALAAAATVLAFVARAEWRRTAAA
jgi:hypothetical protein